MPYQKKVHRFSDCGSNMGAGDRSGGCLTGDVLKTTCGACKQRIMGFLLQADWTALSTKESLVGFLRDLAVHIDNESV